MISNAQAARLSVEDRARILNEASSRVTDAIEALQEARERLEVAGREETSAINQLNEAQKAFDAALTEFRGQTAPRGSDWCTARHLVTEGAVSC